MVNGVIEGMQQKHEKVILFTKENDRRTQKGRSRVTGKRKNKGVVGRRASRRQWEGTGSCHEAFLQGLGGKGLPG